MDHLQSTRSYTLNTLSLGFRISMFSRCTVFPAHSSGPRSAALALCAVRRSFQEGPLRLLSPLLRAVELLERRASSAGLLRWPWPDGRGPTAGCLRTGSQRRGCGASDRQVSDDWPGLTGEPAPRSLPTARLELAETSCFLFLTFGGGNQSHFKKSVQWLQKRLSEELAFNSSSKQSWAKFSLRVTAEREVDPRMNGCLSAVFSFKCTDARSSEAWISGRLHFWGRVIYRLRWCQSQFTATLFFYIRVITGAPEIVPSVRGPGPGSGLCVLKLTSFTDVT